MPGGKIKQVPFSGLFRAFNMQMHTAKKKIEKVEFPKVICSKDSFCEDPLFCKKVI